MEEDFERTSTVVNGYFYTFQYTRASHRMAEQDDTPFVFCVAPHPTNPNLFKGLNLHHLPTSERIALLLILDKQYNIRQEDNRTILDEATIISNFHSSSLAFRYYDRKNMDKVYRVKTSAVGKYIASNGDIYMSNPADIMNKYWANYVGANTVDKIKGEEEKKK